MKFEKTIKYNQSRYVSDSGIYSVVKYTEPHDKPYYAFFIPSGWNASGNSCEKTPDNHNTSYKTVASAKKACVRHFKAFGKSPSQFDHLTN